VLLVAPGQSYRTPAYVEAARRLAVDVVLGSEGEHPVVRPDIRGVRVPIGSADALDRLAGAARELGCTAVVATDDDTVELAAGVGRALGLPHNPVAAVRCSRRKDLGRQALARAGLPVPEHRVLDLSRPLPPQLEGLAYPQVVKPLALSGSRGVIRADDREALLSACARVRAILAGVREPEERDRVLAEGFVPGPEVALEGMLEGGRLQVLALFDKPDPLDGPFFEETYYVTPSRHAPRVQALVARRVEQACRAYGLVQGPVHAEARLSAGEVWVLEVAARTIGGECARLLRFGTGHGLEELVLARAAGVRLDLDRAAGAAGVLMIPIPRPGVLRRVEGVLAAQAVPHVESVEISLREGYPLVPLPEGSAYLGFVFARAPTPEQAERALRDAHARLEVVTAPLLSVAGHRG
jgi:biotin carboxylase